MRQWLSSWWRLPLRRRQCKTRRATRRFTGALPARAQVCFASFGWHWAPQVLIHRWAGRSLEVCHVRQRWRRVRDRNVLIHCLPQGLC